MLKTLEGTRFAGSAIVAVAAKPGGPEVQAVCLWYINMGACACDVCQLIGVFN